MSLIERLDLCLNRISIPYHQTGLRYLRIILGWIILYIYSINYEQRHFLFGPQGVYTQTSAFSLFRIFEPQWFDIMYHLAMAAALCFAVGIGGRIVTFLNFLFFWSWTSVSVLVSAMHQNRQTVHALGLAGTASLRTLSR
jgi:hypothetical protein